MLYKDGKTRKIDRLFRGDAYVLSKIFTCITEESIKNRGKFNEYN